jgi:hypothetical protein
LGHTRSYATRMNLASMVPRNDLASTTFCLANPGLEYLVYQPSGGDFAVDLGAGAYTYEWFNAGEGVITKTGSYQQLMTEAPVFRSLCQPAIGSTTLLSFGAVIGWLP